MREELKRWAHVVLFNVLSVFGLNILSFFRHTTFSVICFQLNRVKAVEKEKDDLEPVRNEAIEFLTMENDIVKKKNLLYQKYQ